jgi:hypothetical protein
MQAATSGCQITSDGATETMAKELGIVVFVLGAGALEGVLGLLVPFGLTEGRVATDSKEQIGPHIFEVVGPRSQHQQLLVTRPDPHFVVLVGKVGVEHVPPALEFVDTALNSVTGFQSAAEMNLLLVVVVASTFSHGAGFLYNVY